MSDLAWFLGVGRVPYASVFMSFFLIFVGTAICMDIFFWGMPKQGFRVTLISLVVAFSTAFFGTAIVSRLIGEIMQTMEPAPVKNNPIQ